MTQTLKGTGVALVTPFSKDLTIDWKGLKKLMDYTAKGVDYYVVLGTTGESSTISAREKAEIVTFVKDNNENKLPIVFGIGGNDTSAVIEQIDKTDFFGIEAILSVSPYYNKPSQEGLYRHFIAIADRSPVPVILYNVPGRTAANIAAHTTLRLAQHKNIIGIKEASGNFEQCMAIAREMPAEFLLISGDDMLTVPMMSIGGVGIISVLANAFPEKFKQISSSGLKGDFKKASKAAFQLLSINPLMYQESNPVGVKFVLNELGICEEWVRLPLVSASASLKEEIRKTLIKDKLM